MAFLATIREGQHRRQSLGGFPRPAQESGGRRRIQSWTDQNVHSVGSVRGVHIPAAASPLDGPSWIATVSLAQASRQTAGRRPRAGCGAIVGSRAGISTRDLLVRTEKTSTYARVHVDRAGRWRSGAAGADTELFARCEGAWVETAGAAVCAATLEHLQVAQVGGPVLLSCSACRS
jgi:hypothetical protein